MTITSSKLIRAYLIENQDGATPAEIGKAIGRPTANVSESLEAMHDCYIDRWTPAPVTGGSRPVWCRADIPEHCPRPEPKRDCRKARFSEDGQGAAA